MNNSYEQLKSQFWTELSVLMPALDRGSYLMIGKALDRAAYRYEISRKETALVPQQDTTPALIKTYLIIKKTEGLSDKTLENYARTLRMFFAWCGKSPEEVTTNDIRMYIYEYQRMHKVTDRTMDKYREFICWFFTWAHTEEYIPRNPARPIKSIKYEVKERQALSQLELEYMRQSCESVRERAILEFMYSTGCRVSELTAVKIADLNLKDNSVHLFGKGKKHRISFINAKCEVALNSYLQSRNDKSEYLFVSLRQPHGKLTKCAVEKVIGQIAARTNIAKRITPHVIRHTTATQAVNNGMPIEDVSKLLGHNNVATTMIYARVSRENVQSQHNRCII